MSWFDPDRTIHLIGDPHAGFVTDARLATLSGDIVGGNLHALAVHHLLIGDICDVGGNAAHETSAATFISDAGMTLRDNADLISGNHDLGGSGEDIGTFNAQWGYSTVNWTRDFAHFRLIGLNPDHDNGALGPQTLEQHTLTYLDDALAGTALPCVIATHAPLMGTHGTTVNFECTHPYDDIVAILDAHDHVAVLMTGHTHPVTSYSRLVDRLTLTTHDIICVNGSGLFLPLRPATGAGTEAQDLHTVFVTMLDDHVAVRIRDHKASAWTDGYSGQYVIRMPFVAPTGRVTHSRIPPFFGEES